MSCLFLVNTHTFQIPPQWVFMKHEDIEVYIVEIGKQIRQLRKEQGLTQLDLSIKSGIDERQVQRLERGHTSATLKTLLKISIGLEVSIVDLFQFLRK